jgi:Mn-dependent DtxR family transcriptional regulator
MVTKPLRKSGIKVLANLCKAKRPLSVKRISERTDLSWKTVNDNIKLLEKRKLIKCERSARRTYCKVRPEVTKICKIKK